MFSILVQAVSIRFFKGKREKNEEDLQKEEEIERKLTWSEWRGNMMNRNKKVNLSLTNCVA